MRFAARPTSTSLVLSLRFPGDFLLESRENGRCTSLATALRLGEDALATTGLDACSDWDWDSLDLMLVVDGRLIREGAVGVDILLNDSKGCLRCGEGTGGLCAEWEGSVDGNATGVPGLASLSATKHRQLVNIIFDRDEYRPMVAVKT